MKMERILVVDDKEENRYLLRTLLHGNGYDVEEARHGAEALEKARQNPPHLIIADILMPVMDGFALCREWKKDASLRSIPFVFYTATYTDERDREFALGIGADRFIVKPQEPETFIAIVRETLEGMETGPASTALPTEAPDTEEAVYLQQYNQALIRKLEGKIEQLDRANRMLEQDIAERTRVEEELQKTLKEKDILLWEVHHRVKNNLMAVISLMDRKRERLTDECLNQAMRELEEQARTMALVYEQLYQSDNLARVEMEPYLSTLSRNVLQAFRDERDIAIDVEATAVTLDVESAMPCGLIVNELVTNAIKYAFPAPRETQGRIWVTLRRDGGIYELTVADNGAGVPAGFSFEGPLESGLHLVRLWATHQLGGTIEMSSEGGTRITVRFKA